MAPAVLMVVTVLAAPASSQPQLAPAETAPRVPVSAIEIVDRAILQRPASDGAAMAVMQTQRPADPADRRQRRLHEALLHWGGAVLILTMIAAFAVICAIRSHARISAGTARRLMPR